MNNDKNGSGTLEFLLISSFNVSNLAALLSKEKVSPAIQAVCAPFGQVMQTLLNPSSDAWRARFDHLIIWTSPESVSPTYTSLLAGEEIEPERLMRDVDDFCAAVRAAPRHAKSIFVPGWI